MREDEHVPVTDDDDAIKRCQQGDIEGLATLIRRYQTDALRLAYLLTGDRYLAEDIVQDGFLQVYRAAARFHLGRPFQPWFHQIVANTTRIRRRSASRRHEVSLDGMLREPGRSINFHVAPQTFSGVTVQPLRLDIGGKGNDFDYLGSGERLILRVSGLAPDTRRSTVANIIVQVLRQARRWTSWRRGESVAVRGAASSRGRWHVWRTFAGAGSSGRSVGND